MPTLTVTYPVALRAIGRRRVYTEPTRWMGVVLSALLTSGTAASAFAQPPSCEDTLRAAQILNETRAQTLLQAEARAAQTLADLVKRIQTLERENADLKAKVEKSAPAEAPKAK